MSAIIRLDPFKCLPDELCLRILSHRGIKDKARSCLVSRAWQRLATDDSLWKDAIPEGSIPRNRQEDPFVKRCVLMSKEGITEQLKSFIVNMPSDQGGTFSCVFPFLSHCTIFAEIKYGLEENPTRNELGIFVGDLSEVRAFLRQDKMSLSSFAAEATDITEHSVRCYLLRTLFCSSWS